MSCARCGAVGPMMGYLDPGAGSMLLQAIAAGTAGVIVVTKMYWARVKRLLRIGKRSPGEPS